jgi:polysaccharide export outer membrane protein
MVLEMVGAHFRKKCAFIAVVAFLSVACSTQQKEAKFDVNLQKPEDVKELQKVEAKLTVTPEKAALHPDYQVMENISVPYVPEYKVGPGDVLEVVYNIRYESSPEPYRLEVQDKISVSFPYYPQFNTTVLVRTDGKVTLPLLGDVQAESKTPMELAAFLNKQYSKTMENPSVSVALEEFNVKIDEMRKAITTAARGQSKIAPVGPDGRIAFPIIGNIQAEGFTLSQLEKIINQRYAQTVRNLNSTLILLEIHHSKFYVFGEVERQGPVEMPSTMSILDGISAAGGLKKTAYTKEIIIFRSDGLERPIALKVDLDPVLTQGMTYADLRLRPADIVFVPKGKIDKFDDLVEKIFTKGLYGVIPFTTTYTIGSTSVAPIIK